MTNLEKMKSALKILTSALVDYIERIMTETYKESAFSTLVTTLSGTQSARCFDGKGGWEQMDLQACLTFMRKTFTFIKKDHPLYKKKIPEKYFSYLSRMFYYRNTYIGHEAAKIPAINNEDIITYLKEIAVFCTPLDKKKSQEILKLLEPPKMITENLVLTPGASAVLKDYFKLSHDVQISVSAAGNAVCDVFCFGLDNDRKLSDDKYLVFYNSKKSPNQEILMHQESPAEFTIQFLKLPQTIGRLVFVLSAGGTNTLTAISSCDLIITQPELPEMKLHLTGADFQSNENAVILAECYRDGKIWNIATPVQKMQTSPKELIESFGGTVI